jgi:hypothetical protein
MMIYAAFVFHYHIIDHSPQIHEQQCVWRVVVTTDYFEDRVDIENLWERVIDTLLDLETGEDVTLMDWSIMEAIPCTDCMTPDSIFVMEKCQLCNAPLCKCTRHKTGTATMRLRAHYDTTLLRTVMDTLSKTGIHVIHFQMSHVPNTIKLSTRNTMVAQSFFELLTSRSTYLPASLGFDDPISAEVAAELVGMTVVYVRQLAAKGLILAKKVGGVHYISRTSLIEYVTIQAYSEQRPERLPLKLRRRDDIIEHFQEWMALEILA